MSIAVPTQAMVLAAGLGKRMRPLTDHMPKPMIEVAGRSLIDRAVDNLEKAGVSNVVVNSSYKAEMLEAYLQKRTSPKLQFSREETPLETGGGIARALHYFGGKPFFAVNGDVIWIDGVTSALLRLAQAWQENLQAMLLLHPVEKAIGYDGKGDFFVNEEGYLTRRKAHETAPYVYAGVQLLHPSLFDDCPQNAFSMNVLYDKAMAQKRPSIKAIIHDGKWLHVGDVHGKELAEAALSSK